MSDPSGQPWPNRHSTVLEVIQRQRQTEAVFKEYERQTGQCICCQSLFEPLERAAEIHGLDLAELLARLRQAIG